jgi:hypothetical protein
VRTGVGQACRHQHQIDGLGLQQRHERAEMIVGADTDADLADRGVDSVGPATALEADGLSISFLGVPAMLPSRTQRMNTLKKSLPLVSIRPSPSQIPNRLDVSLCQAVVSPPRGSANSQMALFGM